MARLSQRAMNNVVIIAMLIMIALFNIDSFLPKPKQPDSRPLLPASAYVLKIEHDNNKLERSGQQWRQVSSVSPLAISPKAQFDAWQHASLQQTTLPDNALQHTEPYIVVAWLAGEPNGLVFAFYPQTNPITVKTNNTWYTLNNASITTLLPWLREPSVKGEQLP